MVSFPNAKINIGLHVTTKRPDGFHAIETLFFPVAGLHDVLEIVPANDFSITLYGLPIERNYNQQPSNANDNLCTKAYRLMQAAFDLPPVAIYLYKTIPTGAGLGGGSSDATHTLVLLNNLFTLNLTTKQLEDYAVQLGSDCAFFVHNKPMMASGRGELLSAAPPLDLQGYFIVIAKPRVFVSTAEAYAGIIPKQPAAPLAQLLAMPMVAWRENIVNDFELSIFEKFPLLAQLKQQFYNHGATYAAMSGSGSAIFGLFPDEQTALQAAKQLPYVITCQPCM